MWRWRMAEKIIAVITTYNEAEAIKGLVIKLLSRVDDVHLVDGGSTDETASIAEQAGANVIAMGTRTPIAECLRIGWKTALEAGATRIVQIDAGWSHNPADLPYLLLSTADVVIGSRFVQGSCYEGNPRRALMSRLAGIACNVAVPGGCWNDWTSGYRVFSRDALEFLAAQDYTATMHSFQIQVLAHAARAGFRIEERPITYIAGRSSFNKKVAREAISVWWRLMKQRENPVNWANPTSFGGIL